MLSAGSKTNEFEFSIVLQALNRGIDVLIKATRKPRKKRRSKNQRSQFDSTSNLLL
jgi:hypothetical protein